MSQGVLLCSTALHSWVMLCRRCRGGKKSASESIVSPQAREPSTGGEERSCGCERETVSERRRRRTGEESDVLCVPVELKLFNALALWIWMKQRLLLPVQTGTGPFFFEDAPFTPNHSESWTCKPVQCSKQVIFERFATFPDFCPNLFEMCSLHQIQNENICTKIN